MRWRIGLLSALAAVLSLFGTGCFPIPENGSDEQKDPHFLDGKRRYNAFDFKGAIDSYEKALEANPRSASAHYELGLIYFQKEPDPAAAIYHLDRYLKIRPGAENADMVKQLIMSQKQELAKTAINGPISERIQRELERLTADKYNLQKKVEFLEAQLMLKTVSNLNAQAISPVTPAAMAKPVTNKPAAAVVEKVAAPASNRVTHADTTPAKPTTVKPAPTTTSVETKPITPLPSSAGSAARTYKVKSGDTPASIARKNGVKLPALLLANPGLDAKRMKVDQVINLPAQ